MNIENKRLISENIKENEKLRVIEKLNEKEHEGSFKAEIEQLKKFHAEETMALYSKIKLYVEEITRL
jgi:hypothetical protein